MAKTAPATQQCPCGSTKIYKTCCEPLHRGDAASTAEALMRSRYTAFALGLTEYIQRSWHPSKRPPPSSAIDNGDTPRWTGLRIHRHEIIDDDRALVEFTARYKINGRAFALREVSHFVRENGHWFYVDGVVASE